MENWSATARKAAVSRCGVGLGRADERGAQEQLSASGVVELLVLDDVAAVLEQERGDRVHDAGPFLAAQGQDEGV